MMMVSMACSSELSREEGILQSQGLGGWGMLSVTPAGFFQFRPQQPSARTEPETILGFAQGTGDPDEEDEGSQLWNKIHVAPQPPGSSDRVTTGRVLGA